MATFRKRGNKYQAQVRRLGHPDISKSFHTLKDAKEWARHMEVQADRHELSPDRRSLQQFNLGQLVIRYRDEILPRKKGCEIETIILNRFLRHAICNKNLFDLKTVDFVQYRDERLQEITAKSLKRQLSPLQNMFAIAREEWGIPLTENPLSKLRLKTTDNRRERRLREGELQRLLEAGKQSRNPHLVPVILFALETAMRRGEILSLCWNQVDLERRSVTILESKNGHSRTIPLTDKAMGILNDIQVSEKGMGNENETYKDCRCNIEFNSKTISKRKVRVSVRPLTIEKVFNMSANATRLSWARLCNRAGIADLHFHDLRHEAISRFFELGLTAPEAASISGHRDMRMLLRYAHASPDHVRNKLGSDRL
ncbi:MAG: tyrosine-type recombinase/integrase [Flavobacteriaceae bacterium]|nr:tyrosine-type recombinase/integrase [Flavobacteriaceae bacterium]MCB1449089.1 tyrosine-type recombinase/integrase [Nitratireductor sp.]